MYTNLENKTREYPKIEFIDRVLRKGEETHYRCFDCGQYIFHNSIYTHKCRVTPKLFPLPLDVVVKYKLKGEHQLPLDVEVRFINSRKKYLKAEIKAREMQLNLMRKLYGDKNVKDNN